MQPGSSISPDAGRTSWDSVRRRLSTSLLTIPAAVLLLAVVLGLLQLNGSSVANISATGNDEPALGSTRYVRSDEWLSRTPLVVRQAALDFPTRTELGIGEHDTGVLSDLPVKSASAVIKPHSWAYFALDVERAFSIEWWLVMAGPFLGVYSLVAVLTRARGIAALAGLMASSAPVVSWWAIPSMGLTVLYGGAAASLAIVALRADGWRRVRRALACGWFAAAFASMLYLPWILPLAMLFVAIIGSQLIGADQPWRRLGVVAATAGGLSAVLLAVYLRDHHDALRAIAGSVYPGERILPAGEARPSLMFGAPFDVFTLAPINASVSGANASEASSGLMLWAPIAVVGGGFAGWRGRDPVARALAATMAVAIGLAAWALLPVPSIVGSLTGLDRVQGSRLTLPLTIASAVAAGLWVHRWRTDPDHRPSRARIAIAALAFGFVTARVGQQLLIDGDAPSRPAMLAMTIAATAVVVFVLHGRVALGLGGACLLALFSTARINPLQVGLDPITDNPLSAQVEDFDAAHPDARWAAVGVEFQPRSAVAAAGVDSATGISWYADEDMWTILDPNENQRDTWDRFALISIEVDDTLLEVRLELAQADYLIIRTPSCVGALQILDIDYIVAGTPQNEACLRLVDQPDVLGERLIYEVLDNPRP